MFIDIWFISIFSLENTLSIYIFFIFEKVFFSPHSSLPGCDPAPCDHLEFCVHLSRDELQPQQRYFSQPDVLVQAASRGDHEPHRLHSVRWPARLQRGPSRQILSRQRENTERGSYCEGPAARGQRCVLLRRQ